MAGDVEITIVDNNANIVVPLANVQLVIGCASSGPTAQVVATRSAKTLLDTFGGGELVEAASLSVLGGATVLAMRAASATPGSCSAVTFSGTGTSVITTTGAPVDAFLIVFKVITGGTRGTAGITFQISLDAGRTFGPTIALGTATTYLIAGTGVTLNFGVGTLVAGDTAKIGCTAPLWSTAGIQACLNALQASPYAVTGWGSSHLVGIASASDAATIQGYLDTLALGYLFTRLLISARDASPAAAWGGTGEAEATWITSLQTAWSATSAKRICTAAGYYNMPSAFPTAIAGAPKFRRSLQWAHAARVASIPPQRHAGRVRDGSLSNIVLDPVNDPSDGFVYHDARINTGLDSSRFTTARTRMRQPGLFIAQPNLMSPPGSDFSILPYGSVMDVACGITHATGQLQINDDVRLQKNGTLFENDARTIEREIKAAIDVAMTSQSMISSCTVVVDRTTNVQTLKYVAIDVTIVARGYVLSERVNIAYNNPLAAAA